MSPYTSIKDVVKHIAGAFVKHFVAERFSNIKNIKKVTCAAFFVHGKYDKIVPCEHS